MRRRTPQRPELRVVGALDLDGLPRRAVLGVVGEQPDLVDQPALGQPVEREPVVQPHLVQRRVVEADAVGRAREARRVAVDPPARLGQVDDADDARSRGTAAPRDRGNPASARTRAGRRAAARPRSRAAASREAVDEVDHQHPRPHRPDAVVVGDQPRVRVDRALRVRPEQAAMLTQASSGAPGPPRGRRSPGAMIAPGWAISSSATSASVVSSSAATDAACSRRQPRHADRVDHALLEQVAELAGERVRGRGRRASRAPGRSPPGRRSRRWRRSSTAARLSTRRTISAPRRVVALELERVERRARRAAARCRRRARCPRPTAAWVAASAPSVRRRRSSEHDLGRRADADHGERGGEPREALLQDLDVALVRRARELVADLGQPRLDRLARAAALDERASSRAVTITRRARAEVLAARRRRASARPPRRSPRRR